MVQAASCGEASEGPALREPSAWVQAHEALSRLAKARALGDAEEGRWLLAALRSAAHVFLGFGSFGEYIERLFGYGRRQTQEKLRVAEALEGLPELRRALENGALSWSAVRELTRVAVPETERDWLMVSRGKSVRQLEELVAGRVFGDGPSAPADASARRHVLRFEIQGETLAVFRQAVSELRRRSGSSLSDDGVLLELARHVLGGPSDEGRASYQIAVTICAECGKGSQEAGGELVTVGAAIVDMAQCDGQHLGRVDVQPANDALAAQARVEGTGAHVGVGHEEDALIGLGRSGSETGTVDKSVAVCAHGEENVIGADAGGARTEGAGAHVDARAEEGANTARRARGDARRAHVTARAKQSVAPAVRRAVLRRDHHGCRVPGCRNSTFVDVHHIELRSEGGSTARRIWSPCVGRIIGRCIEEKSACNGSAPG